MPKAMENWKHLSRPLTTCVDWGRTKTHGFFTIKNGETWNFQVKKGVF